MQLFDLQNPKDGRPFKLDFKSENSQYNRVMAEMRQNLHDLERKAAEVEEFTEEEMPRRF